VLDVGHRYFGDVVFAAAEQHVEQPGAADVAGVVAEADAE
jgi:hypothetical protein